jgi:hypothetical protein
MMQFFRTHSDDEPLLKTKLKRAPKRTKPARARAVAAADSVDANFEPFA